MKTEGRRARILIVEDEAIISLAVKRLLSSFGYEVTGIASNAVDAIRAIETAAPDLVLMDIHIMGPTDGVETALKIRKDFRLPVVFVTAHADKKTLSRASESEPFGYVVKPISDLNLISTMEMALHKHQLERQLERHRGWLTTILRSIPGAVLVTDLTGEVQFVNSAVEDLVGLPSSEVVGKSIENALPLSCGQQNNLVSHLLDKAEWGSCVPLPKETRLQLPIQNSSISVEGEVSISYADEIPVGAIFILRDSTRREQAERILQQEEPMQALGQLTSGIAADLNSLHNLVGATSSVAGVVASIAPVLNRLGGRSLQVDIHLTDKSTLVLCHPGRLQTLLVNVFLNARARLAGSGCIRISTHQAPGQRVRILFELEHLGTLARQPLSFPLEMGNPDFSLSIAQAIVTAMEGSIAFKLLSETQANLEILLPLQYSARDFTDALNRLGSVLLVGADLQVLAKIEAQLEEERYAVIRCASTAEALLLGQLHNGSIDCVVADGDSEPFAQRRKLLTFFESRSSQTRFVRLTSKNQLDEQGWDSLPKSFQFSFPERLNRLLRPRGFAVGAC